MFLRYLLWLVLLWGFVSQQFLAAKTTTFYTSQTSEYNSETQFDFEKVYADVQVINGFKVIPALALDYLQNKNENKKLTDLTFLAVDVASMGLGVGELAVAYSALSKSRKVFLALDLLNGAANIIVNTTSLQEDPTVQKFLTAYNLLTAFQNIGSSYSKVKTIQKAEKVLQQAGNFAKYTKIWSYLGDGRIKAYLNNQQLLDFENLLKTANDEVLKVMDEFKSADEFAEMVRGYKDGLQLNPSGFANAIKSVETFSGSRGWLRFWRLTPKMESSLNIVAQLKVGNKLDNIGNATDIQLASIHTYTANGDFINVPYRYNPTWFGEYNTRAIQHINEGLNELRKIPSRKIIDQTVFSGKTFSKTDFESKFLGKKNTTHSYNGYMSTSKLESVAEGFIDLTKQWATGSGEKIAVIQRVTSKNGVYIDAISDWGRNLGKTNHPDPKFINVQIQEEVLLNSQKLKQISEPIPVMVNGVHKTIDGMKVYYVDFIEIL